jgi:hypothetical protein
MEYSRLISLPANNPGNLDKHRNTLEVFENVAILRTASRLVFPKDFRRRDSVLCVHRNKEVSFAKLRLYMQIIRHAAFHVLTFRSGYNGHDVSTRPVSIRKTICANTVYGGHLNGEIE